MDEARERSRSVGDSCSERTERGVQRAFRDWMRPSQH